MTDASRDYLNLLLETEDCGGPVSHVAANAVTILECYRSFWIDEDGRITDTGRTDLSIANGDWEDTEGGEGDG